LAKDGSERSEDVTIHHHHDPNHAHPPASVHPSILRLSAAERLAVAAFVIALVWGAVYWAIR